MKLERIGVDENDAIDEAEPGGRPRENKTDPGTHESELLPSLETAESEDTVEGKIREESTSMDGSAGPEVAQDIEAIPPVLQIRNLLTEFEMKVPVWGLTVFTVDGYILAHRLFYEGMPENIEMAVSSMSAGLITISEDFIRLVNDSSLFRQVLVDAEDKNSAVDFSILLKHIAENVMLTVIFPSSIQLGLVTFEIENLSQAITEVVGLWDVKLHDETMT
ncbi:MAG: roadblock/LC7 domain-containing protein [Candidatus Thorarchaeota archaeon]